MSKRIEELLEEYSSNRKQYTGEKHFKFLKKVFKAFKEVGALNISFIYYTLNSNSPKIMDSEFMKAYIESMLKDNHTLINIFTGYWENNRGLELTEGLNVNFNMILKEEEVFAALIANNELEKVLQLLSITYYRIKSLTETTSEDLFYSKCLSDYEREDFKNAVSGLQFFGFGKKEKEEKARKKFERELYSEMELEYIKDKSNGLAKDIKMLQDEVVNSLKKQNVFKIPQDLNRDGIDLTLHAPTGEDINLSNPDKKTLDSITDNYGKISFLQFDSREGKFSIQKESDFDEEDGWMDIADGVDAAVDEAFANLKISNKLDYGDNDSWVEYYINVETLFNLNDKYKKLFEKRAKEEFNLDDF